MSQLSEMTAIGWEREIAGRTWRFAPLTLADWAVLERRLIESRPDPLAIAKRHAPGLGDEERRMLFEAALVEATRRRRASLAELLEFADSPAGLLLSVWLALRHEQRDVSEAQAAELLQQMTAEELDGLQRSLDDLQGLPAEPPKN